MPKTVRFLTECAGRNKGVIETVNDDTLAQNWVNAKLAEFTSAPPPEPKAPEKTKGPTGPPVDRAPKRAPRTK